jgi:CrcB protein
MTWLLVALGAAVGAPARYLLDTAVSRRWRTALPLGTLVVNVLGCALLGALAATVPHGGPAYAAVGTGLCGAFTTFSTFTWETLALAEEGANRAAVANVVVSVVLGLAAAAAAFHLAS